MRSTVLIVAILAVVANAGLFSRRAAPETTMYGFLKGDWNVLVYRSSVDKMTIPEEQDNMFFTFAERVNNSYVLDGSYVTDDGRRYFKVEFTGKFLGEFFVAKEEVYSKKEEKAEIADDNNEVKEQEEEKKEEEAAVMNIPDDMWNPLFKIDFQNLTKLQFISQGTLATGGVYQSTISVAQAPSFVFTVHKDKEVITYLAVKKIAARTPSFFEKYGMFIMLAFMMFMNGGNKGMAPPPQQGQGQGEGEGEGEGEGNATQGTPAGAAEATE